MRCYFDSDILIWHLRGQGNAATFFSDVDRIEGREFWIGAIQRAEVLFYVKGDEEPRTRNLLSRFRTHPITEDLVEKAARVYYQWNPSHGIGMNDALLAASVLELGGILYTKNVKHFPMPGLNVQKPW